MPITFDTIDAEEKMQALTIHLARTSMHPEKGLISSPMTYRSIIPGFCFLKTNMVFKKGPPSKGKGTFD